jgi:hypothetical protein
MPRWLAYILLAVTVIAMVAGVVAVASGSGTLAFIALVVVGFLWVSTMRGLRNTGTSDRDAAR